MQSLTSFATSLLHSVKTPARPMSSSAVARYFVLDECHKCVGSAMMCLLQSVHPKSHYRKFEVVRMGPFMVCQTSAAVVCHSAAFIPVVRVFEPCFDAQDSNTIEGCTKG